MMLGRIVPEGADPAHEMSGAALPHRTHKLKGRKRLLNGLNRMASSPSLARLGRASSSSLGSRRLGTSSMSCASLSSTTSYRNCWDDSNSRGYGGPGRKPATPYSLEPNDEHHEPSRVVDADATLHYGQQITSIALPADIQLSSRFLPLESPTEIPEPSELVTSYNRDKGAAERPNVDLFSDLPTETKMGILRYLNPKELFRCSQVSKSWNEMCFDGQLWARLDTSTYYRDIPRNALIKIILSAGPFLKDLNLRGCLQLFDVWCSEGERITDACRNLAYINIEDCLMDKTTAHYFFIRNPALIHINMCGVSTVTNSAMRVISKSCPNLEYLNISWCKGIDTNGLAWIVKSCHQLKDLCVSRISGFDNEQFMLKLFNANTLERLIMSNCPSLTDESLATLLHGVDPEVDPMTNRTAVPPRKLKHLDLSNCRDLTDISIQHLANIVPRLECLKLSFCSNITDESLLPIINSTPLLTHLEIEELGELTNEFLIELSKAPCAPNLEHLNISYCEKLGDTGMIALLRSSPNIRSLDLDNTRISDLTLMEICSQMRKRGNSSEPPKIGMRLAVFDCGNVTWAGVREILSNNCSMSHMSYTHSPNESNSSLLTTSSTATSTSISTSSTSSSPSSLSADSDSPTAASTPAHEHSPPPSDQYPAEIIRLKCFYGWQLTVDEHTKRVLRGNLTAAVRLERKWADYMMANEEAGTGIGSTRRRRRARDLETLYRLEDEQAYGYSPAGLASFGGNRRSGCIVM